jgi:hypothetical protein
LWFLLCYVIVAVCFLNRKQLNPTSNQSPDHPAHTVDNGLTELLIATEGMSTKLCVQELIKCGFPKVTVVTEMDSAK